MKIRKLWRQNDVNLAKIRHVFYYNLLTDVVLEHSLQIYSKVQWYKHRYRRSPISMGRKGDKYRSVEFYEKTLKAHPGTWNESDSAFSSNEIRHYHRFLLIC